MLSTALDGFGRASSRFEVEVPLRLGLEILGYLAIGDSGVCVSTRCTEDAKTASGASVAKVAALTPSHSGDWWDLRRHRRR
jgi:hypothetical protein